jgi:hypothetical protein
VSELQVFSLEARTDGDFEAAFAALIVRHPSVVLVEPNGLNEDTRCSCGPMN